MIISGLRGLLLRGQGQKKAAQQDVPGQVFGARAHL
jgi:hypothetical protein